jgi:hypothetical protein
VLASLPVAPFTSGLAAWLYAHWPQLLLSVIAGAGGAGVVLALALARPASAPPPPPPVRVSVAYADTIHSGAGPADLPSPWRGSPNVTFSGAGDAFDAGAIRIENGSDRPVRVDRVTVDVGQRHFDLWGSPLQVPAHGSLILTQTQITSRDPFTTDFDTSETDPPNCLPSSETPIVQVTVDGKTRDYRDSDRVLTAGGVDRGMCGGREGHQWERLSG